jgi:hypothetical protein
MDKRMRSSIAVGLFLVLLGIAWLVVQFVPGLSDLINIAFGWPMIIVGVGGMLLVFGLAFGAPAMAVPAFIVAGIGGILYWQNETGNWQSWSYIWTLIPGFVGLGQVVAGVLGENPRRSIREGLRAIFASIVLFLIFGSFFGALGFLGRYWPVLLILLGVLILVQGFLRPRWRE